jgi:ribulose-phosphate 3-epimerase
MADGVLMAPSILSADFTRLAEAVDVMETAEADFIHVDVMDGHFVPNLTIGPPVIAALKRATDIPLDVHLMIDNADDTVGWYLEAGADLVVVHAEAVTNLHRVIGAIHAEGARAGVSVNPATPVEVLEDILGDLDLVLLMSVNPGFGGQSFIRHTVDKVARLKAMCDRLRVHPLIEVDGGINEETGPLVVAAGARVLVAGNAVFGDPDPVAALRRIRTASAAALV